MVDNFSPVRFTPNLAADVIRDYVRSRPRHEYDELIDHYMLCYDRAVLKWQRLERDERFTKAGKMVANGLFAAFAEGTAVILDNNSVTTKILVKNKIKPQNITVVEVNRKSLRQMRDYEGPQYISGRLGQYLRNCGRRADSIWADLCRTVPKMRDDIHWSAMRAKSYLGITSSMRVKGGKEAVLSELREILGIVAKSRRVYFHTICSYTYGTGMLFVLFEIENVKPNTIISRKIDSKPSIRRPVIKHVRMSEQPKQMDDMNKSENTKKHSAEASELGAIKKTKRVKTNKEVNDATAPIMRGSAESSPQSGLRGSAESFPQSGLRGSAESFPQSGLRASSESSNGLVFKQRDPTTAVTSPGGPIIHTPAQTVTPAKASLPVPTQTSLPVSMPTPAPISTQPAQTQTPAHPAQTPAATPTTGLNKSIQAVSVVSIDKTRMNDNGYLRAVITSDKLAMESLQKRMAALEAFMKINDQRVELFKDIFGNCFP